MPLLSSQWLQGLNQPKPGAYFHCAVWINQAQKRPEQKLFCITRTQSTDIWKNVPGSFCSAMSSKSDAHRNAENTVKTPGNPHCWHHFWAGDALGAAAPEPPASFCAGEQIRAGGFIQTAAMKWGQGGFNVTNSEHESKFSYFWVQKQPRSQAAHGTSLLLLVEFGSALEGRTRAPEASVQRSQDQPCPTHWGMCSHQPPCLAGSDMAWPAGPV